MGFTENKFFAIFPDKASGERFADDLVKKGFVFIKPRTPVSNYLQVGKHDITDFCPVCSQITNRVYISTNWVDCNHWTTWYCFDCGGCWYDHSVISE